MLRAIRLVIRYDIQALVPAVVVRIIGVIAIANQRTDTRNAVADLLNLLTVAAQNTTVPDDLARNLTNLQRSPTSLRTATGAGPLYPLPVAGAWWLQSADTSSLSPPTCKPCSSSSRSTKLGSRSGVEFPRNVPRTPDSARCRSR